MRRFITAFIVVLLVLDVTFAGLIVYRLVFNTIPETKLGVVAGFMQLMVLIALTLSVILMYRRWRSDLHQLRILGFVIITIVLVMVLLGGFKLWQDREYQLEYRPLTATDLIEEIVGCRPYTIIDDDSYWVRIKLHDGSVRVTRQLDIDVAQQQTATMGAGPGCTNR